MQNVPAKQKKGKQRNLIPHSYVVVYVRGAQN